MYGTENINAPDGGSNVINMPFSPAGTLAARNRTNMAFKIDDIVLYKATGCHCIVEDATINLGSPHNVLYCVRYMEGPNSGRGRIVGAHHLQLVQRAGL